ncbi:MAG: DNA gyrase subunit A [Haliscomenobacter sp.]|nr:DNA gyrase subunit A [Haliscomenobacter sp.]MCF8317756.1 DNA gyrase subunit A [Haliscomenobacter sp.]
MTPEDRIIPIQIEDEMKSAYIDYSMSVIVSRALPDVRDGMKPVQRRVLYAMSDLGLTHNKAHKKSARIVGEVLGKYHPHGDTSVYDTMVRMAQDWSLRYPLVDPQGNFGNIDGDGPAAMRYTEARLKKISDEILADIDKDTVDFTLNFDDSLEEPSVLPTKVPNLLINGASGIAVGMATNLMPHNLTEVIDGIVATLADPEIDVDGLMQYIKAPDFPTGGIIYGTKGVREGFATGRGKIVLRGRAEIETSASGRESIIITEIPYQVNKSMLVAKIAELTIEKKIPGISDVRDESARQGMRVVVEIKRDAMAKVVLSQLYKYSPLQTSYGINNVALVGGRPEILCLKDMIVEFIKFRLEVIVKRTKYDLKKAKERAHILEGILIALDHLDEVIALIRASKNVDEAKEGLMSTFGLSEIQAKAILEMRLQRLTGLERDKVRAEYKEVMDRIAYYESILASEEIQREIVRTELLEIKDNYGDARRTEIVAAEGDINMEDLIKEEEVVVTISNLGYIKRTAASEFRTQSRGGRGAKGSRTRDEDFIVNMFVANSHNYLLLFTESGKCFWLRVFEIPEASKSSAGRAIQNILNIAQDDKVKAYINIPNLNDSEFVKNHYIIFCTHLGIIKKTAVEAYSRPRVGGINAITIAEGDMLLSATLTGGDHQIFLASRRGYAVRFHESKVRPMGRNATGVKGMALSGESDAIVGMLCINPAESVQDTILVVSEKGNGKRSEVDEYRLTNRGAKGVKTMQITDKTGALIAMKAVQENEDLMITNRSGIIIRMAVSTMRVIGRATQGVRVIRLDEDDAIADVAVIPYSPEIELPEGEENIESSMENNENSIDNQDISDNDTEIPQEL